MKAVVALLVACAAVSPIEKTIQLLGDLQAKIVKGASERASATIADETAKIGAAEAKIDELSTTIATNEKDLGAATEIREKEHADFLKMDADLAETVDMLTRAIGIIERELAKTGSFIQSDSMKKVTDALEGLMDAASVNSLDKSKVQALLQSQSGDGDMDLALALQPGGAPDPAAYKAKSGGILDTLEDMLEKAKAEHADAQKAEMNAKFDFDMLKQKLEDAMSDGNKELGETKTEKAAAEEAKAVAEGELETADKGVADDSKKLQDLQQECMTKATDYETSQHSRSEELAALDKAKTILKEKTGGAAERSYSFLQLEVRSRVSSKAQRVQSAMLTSADPFAKVKGMIQEMIEKLVADAQKEASHKAFCDKEMSETKAKRD